MATDEKRIAVIGAGTMGRGIAQVFAQSGYTVYLNDVLPQAMDSALAQIGKMLDRAVEKEKISAADAAAALFADAQIFTTFAA